MKEQDNQPKSTKKGGKLRTVVLVAIGLIVIVGIFGNKPEDTDTKKDTTASTASTGDTDKTPPKEEKIETKPEQPKVPVEYTSALAQADSYANRMHMSKQGVYDQLVSEYGGQFKKEAAQYAIDNVKSNWNTNALESAKTYQERMHMSPAAIHDQLTSAYGGQFTSAEADYAIAHLND